MGEATSSPVNAAGQSARVLAPDLLRGLIMVVMALDHVRSFFMTYDGVKEVWFKPATYNPDVWDFAARYVSHLAAPGFFFLMGLGMVLFARSRVAAGWDYRRIANSFFIRGLSLVIFQIILENSAWAIRSDNWARILSTGVLGTLGMCMVLTALSLQMRTTVLVIVAAVILLASQAFILSLEGAPGANLLLTLLLVPDRWDPQGWVAIRSNYPIIQWYAVTLLGVVFGRFWCADREKAYRWALWGGLALVALFFPLRLMADGFWNLRGPVDDTFFALIQATKYPPSLSWLALTLGVNGILLWGFSRTEEACKRVFPFLLAYGRAPLVFYVLHLHLYAAISLFVFNKHEDVVSWAGMWWLIGLAVLWPISHWYSCFKGAKPPESLWRIF